MDINVPRRIDYDNGLVYKNLTTLRELLHHHVFAIPFETLDIHNQIPILLQTDFLFQKVILDRRGGYCYELNFPFYQLLSLCGFQVTRWPAGCCTVMAMAVNSNIWPWSSSCRFWKWLVDGLWRFFLGTPGHYTGRDPG